MKGLTMKMWQLKLTNFISSEFLTILISYNVLGSRYINWFLHVYYVMLCMPGPLHPYVNTFIDFSMSERIGGRSTYYPYFM